MNQSNKRETREETHSHQMIQKQSMAAFHTCIKTWWLVAVATLLSRPANSEPSHPARSARRHA